MPGKKGDRPLKVCHTCRHWSTRYKGFCARLQQGVGRFWICEDWTESLGEENHPKNSGEPEGAGSPRR